MLSPKQKFQKHANFREFASMINSNNMEYALETALFTFTDNIGGAKDAAEAAALHCQLVGAKRILAILKDLATIPSEPKPNRIGQLNQT